MVHPTQKINAIKAARKGVSSEGSVLLNRIKRRVSTGAAGSKAAFTQTRFQQTLEASSDQSRLLITKQPAKKFYTCTAKTNRLRVEVCLPNSAAAPASMPVDLVLIYAKTQREVE